MMLCLDVFSAIVLYFVDIGINSVVVQVESAKMLLCDYLAELKVLYQLSVPYHILDLIE